MGLKTENQGVCEKKQILFLLPVIKTGVHCDPVEQYKKLLLHSVTNFFVFANQESIEGFLVVLLVPKANLSKTLQECCYNNANVTSSLTIFSASLSAPAPLLAFPAA